MCNHMFIGKADGVHCTVCGLHMNASTYIEYLKSGEIKEKPKRQARKKVKTDE